MVEKKRSAEIKYVEKRVIVEDVDTCTSSQRSVAGYSRASMPQWERERTSSVETEDSVHLGQLFLKLEDEGWRVKDTTCRKERIDTIVVADYRCWLVSLMKIG